MRDIRFLVKGKRFVKISLVEFDEVSRPVLSVTKGMLSEIDLETGNFIYDNDSIEKDDKYGKTYGEFKDVVAIIVAKLLGSEFFELKNYTLNREFFENRVKVSDNTPNYVEKRLKKIN